MTRPVSRRLRRKSLRKCRRYLLVILGGLLALALLPTRVPAQAPDKDECGRGRHATLQGVDVQYLGAARFAICAKQVEAAGTRATGTWNVKSAEFELHGQVLALLPPTTGDVHRTWCVQYDYGDNRALEKKHAIWWIRDIGDGVTALDQVRLMQFDVDTWSCENPPRFVPGASLDPAACIHMDDFAKGNPSEIGVGCFRPIGGGDFVGKVP